MLDPYSMSYALGITSLFSALAFSVLMRSGEKIPGGRAWIIAQLCFAFALFVGALRGTLPLALTLVASNAFVIASIALQFEAISLFRRVPYSWPLLYGYVGVGALAIAGVSIVTTSLRPTVLLVSVLHFPITVGIAWQLIVRQRGRIGLSDRLMVGATTLQLLAVLFRAGGTFFVDFGPKNALPENAIQTIFYGIVFVAVIAVQSAYVLMTKEESDRRLMDLATIDALTGIWNRRTFMQQATTEAGRCRRNHQPFAVLMFDLDRFKLVNDTYGHAAGDTVLHAFATTAKAELRQYDLFGRIGGEEFAALLPSATESEAIAIAERIRAACAESAVPFTPAPLHFSTSIGVAESSGADETVEDLLRRADEALYEAKDRGRNRVVAAHGARVDADAARG